MSGDTFARIVEALANLIKAIAWPGVALLVFLLFRSALTDFIGSLGEFTFKGGGFEATGKKVKAEATAALAAAAAARPADDANPVDVAKDTREAASVVANVVTPRIIRRANAATILWVDDKPSNNVHEREALGALGISFTIAKSTDEALQCMQEQSFDAIISDLGRPGDARAGFTLLEKIRSTGNLIPFVFYSASPKPEYRAEASRLRAIGFTNRPNDLFKMVLSALGATNQPR